jgi:ELWxxDGT repeat protein
MRLAGIPAILAATIGILALGLAPSTGATPAKIASNAPDQSFPAKHGVAADGLLYDGFSPDLGREPWRSDGTAAGTMLLKDIATDSGISFPSAFTTIGATTFFVASGLQGRELWKTEGTPQSTVLVSDIRPGPDGSNPAELANAGGKLYFAVHGAGGVEVWRSDGTAEGTVLVKAGLPPGGGDLPTGFTALGDIVFFSADDGIHGVELWRSDGTPAGTMMVRDINPGAGGSSGPTGLTVANGVVFFTAWSGSGQQQLWRTDGTEAGTYVTRQIDRGVTPAYSDGDMKAVGNLVYFVAAEDLGSELWRSDGTPAGTYRVADLCPGPCDSTPRQMVSLAGILYFVAFDDAHGWEVWRSDGTATGTRLLKDVRSGSGGIPPSHLTVAGGRLFFVADDGANGSELWVSDGTDSGTTLHADLSPGSAGTQFSWLAASSQGLFFATARPNDFLHDLWYDALPCTANDGDEDGLPNCVELAEGRDPAVKDNDVFTIARLFAMQQYRDFLGREGDAGGIAFYTNQIDSTAMTRAQALESFFNSAEFQGSVAPVVRLYYAYFLRFPDYQGLTFWADYYRAGHSLAEISDHFAASPEFIATYGALDNGQFVTLVYNNVLGREPDAGGYAFYKGHLDSNTMTRGEVLLAFSESSEYAATSFNMVYVTMMYAGMLRRHPDESGFEFWVGYINQGNSGLELINGFLDGPEYRARFLP